MPLTAAGRRQARLLAARLRGRRFALVLTSPAQRARETCRLSGFGTRAVVADDLHEWDYGTCEGRTTPEIRQETPGWTLWRDGPLGGETIEEVSARADRILERARQVTGEVLVFSHGHLLRILGARWLGLDAACGRHLALAPASWSALGHEHEQPVIDTWNSRPEG